MCYAFQAFTDTGFNLFMLGAPNFDDTNRLKGRFYLDEFLFWPELKDEDFVNALYQSYTAGL